MSIKDYCNNKRIAIIGNSSKILDKNLGKEIDAHDIIVRMNHAPLHISKYTESTGAKTNIISFGMSNLTAASKISNLIKPEYNLFLIRCNGPVIDKNEYIQFKNPVHGDLDQYRELSSKFNIGKIKYKPSTGSVTVNYFLKNINFSQLNLYGFDFFKSSSGFKRNEFNSYMYKDHSPDLELGYINSILNDNIIIRD